MTISTAESLQQALEHHRAGRFEMAEQQYRQVLASEPHNAHAMHLMGALAYERGHREIALNYIAQAIALDRTQVTFHINMAMVLISLGRMSQAVDSMRQVLALEPERVTAHNDLGVLLVNLGRWDEAEECFRAVLAIRPEDATACNNLGNVLNQQGKIDEAIACFREALRLSPGQVQAHSNLANSLKMQGQLDEAVSQYREAVRIDPNYAEAFYNLAIALRDSGKADEAIAAYREAVRIRPDFVEARFNLGSLFRAQGLLDEAAEELEQVLERKPEFAEAHYLLGGILHGRGERERATAEFQQAIRWKPTLAEAHQALANLLLEQGQEAEALPVYQEALRHNPRLVHAHLNLGAIMARGNRLLEAVDCFRHALEIDSQCAEAYSNLGLVYQNSRRMSEAIGCHREAVRLRPASAVARNALGTALELDHQYEEAIECFREAVRMQPDFAAAYNNLGAMLKVFGKNGESIVCFEEALRLNAGLIAAAERGEPNPDQPPTQGPALASMYNNRAIALLLGGDFAAGWPEYESRWHLADAPTAPSTTPMWDGAPLKGRTILLFPEQGLGDALQFIRYAPLVKKRGGRVVACCPRKMIPILSTCAGVDQFVAADPLVPFDTQAALLSLPGIFKTDLASIPAQVPYLHAQPQAVAAWRAKLAERPGLRVGIAWQGNPAYKLDSLRSIPLTQFTPLAAIPGVRLLSLQKGAGSEQVLTAGVNVENLASLLDEKDGAFCDTAAVIASLDLVITSDTAIAHLAGALGAPVWLALPLGPDWRWLLERDDSPWYPSMRLFRQWHYGDWNEVFERVATELSTIAASRKQ